MTRSPVWAASMIIAWSRLPVQVLRSGASMRAFVSGSVRKVTSARSWRLVGIASTRSIGLGVLWVAERGVAVKGTDRGQPCVAGAGAVSPLVLEMVKERADQRRVQFVDLESGWLLAGALGGEGEQQPHRVAVGGDRVRAGVALAHRAGR